MAHGAMSASQRYRPRLAVVTGLTAAWMVAQFVGGLITGSLALVADATHMLADVGGLLLALVAIWFAGRPATETKSFGYYRAEVLAALTNGALLFALSGYILYEAWQRLREPATIDSTTMILIAAVGLVVNLVGAMLLHQGAGESLNVQGAFLEVLSDLLSSGGVLVAGIVIAVTGWWYADPLVSALIGVFILPRTYRLTSRAVHILLEGTPEGIDLGEVAQRLLDLPEVRGVHDLHVWSITSGIPSLSVHVEVEPGADTTHLLGTIQQLLADRFDLRHSTIQLEPEPCQEPFFHELPAEPTTGERQSS